MKYDLAVLVKRARNPRRSLIPLRPIKSPAMLASDLYASCYAPVVRQWAAAIDPIVAAYERSLAEMVTDSAADIQTQVSGVEVSVSAVFVTVRARIAAWANRLELFHRRKWAANVLSATSVDLGTMIGADDTRSTLEVLIERNVGLVRSVSDETRRRIADAAFRGLTNRTPAREIAREIREAVGMERKRALRIAADQNVKLGAALNDERRRQAGISGWIWVHSDKKFPREEHKARDGFLYSDDPEMVGQTYEGKRVRKPPEERPSQAPYCGCTSRAVLML